MTNNLPEPEPVLFRTRSPVTAAGGSPPEASPGTGDATCSPSARSARHRARGTVWSAGRGGRMVVHGGEDGDGCGGGGGGVRLFSGCPMGPPSRVCVAGSLSADAGAAR
eukprot:12598097-Ditylum_brightwellii.AAC.1